MIILEEIHTPFGTIKVTRSKSDGTCTYQQEDCLHSAINEEGVSTCAYVHALHSIIQQCGAKRVLMIGCAGGTLATMLHKAACEVTVVDMNPVSFTLAKHYFHMPEGITCVVEEGGAYLANTRRRYDAIVIDAFNNDGSIPEQFISESFFTNVKDALSPKGIVLMNIITLHDLDHRSHRIAAGMRQAGFTVVLFDKPGIEYRNTIIAGGIPHHVRIPSGREPAFIREELRAMVRLRPVSLGVSSPY